MKLLFSHPNTTSSNGEEKIEGPLLAAVIVINSIIIALGILGNSIIIYLVFANIKLRNVRNAFMLNLTFSNLLLVTICTPSFLVSISFESWMMGKFWCQFLHSIQIVIILVSSFSIMMIAIDRWMFVVFSQSRQLQGKDAAIIILFIWIISIMLSMPTFLSRTITNNILDDASFYLKIKELTEKLESSPKINSKINISLQGQYTKYCYEQWSDTLYKRIYILILFVLEFVLPCLTMLITYIWIIRFLKIQDNKMNHYEMLHKRLVQKERHHQKSCKLLSALCLTFIICCLPLSFFNIKAEFNLSKYIANNSESFKQTELYSPLTILTTLEELNTILSPLLYGWMNHNFRNVINQKLNDFRKDYVRVKASKNQTLNRPSKILTPNRNLISKSGE